MRARRCRGHVAKGTGASVLGWSELWEASPVEAGRREARQQRQWEAVVSDGGRAAAREGEAIRGRG